MKKYLLTAALAVMGMAAFADDITTTGAAPEDFTDEVYYNDAKGYSVQTNSFWKNWFLGVGVGAQTLFSEHDRQIGWGKRITPTFDIAVGKWFTPGIGVRGMVSGFTLKGATQGNLEGGPVSTNLYGSAYSTGEKFFASTRHECLSPRVCLECNPEIPVTPGEEHWFWTEA